VICARQRAAARQRPLCCAGQQGARQRPTCRAGKHSARRSYCARQRWVPLPCPISLPCALLVSLPCALVPLCRASLVASTAARLFPVVPTVQRPEPTCASLACNPPLAQRHHRRAAAAPARPTGAARHRHVPSVRVRGRALSGAAPACAPGRPVQIQLTRQTSPRGASLWDCAGHRFRCLGFALAYADVPFRLPSPTRERVNTELVGAHR
jgi:hypothetical protein